MKNILSILAISSFLLTTGSCQKCETCERHKTVYFRNIPSLSGISMPDFNANPIFQTQKDTFFLGEVCGSNLGETPEPDTLVYDNPIDIDMGGIFQITTVVDKCK